MDINTWEQNHNNTYIGRPSKWGNPFSVRKFPRALSVAKFSSYIKNNSDLMNDMHELKGQTLGCFCASKDSPFLCHGLVLIQLYKLLFL